MGVTDVDDKIINKSKEENIDPLQLSRVYEKLFFQDLISLNVKINHKKKNLNIFKVTLPDTILRVSEHIEDIIKFIQEIQKNGYAYQSNGSIYFDSESFRKNGGKQKLFSSDEETQETQISQTNEKKNAQDFALWKKVEDKNSLYWDSPFGNGRPGWHIECSAMIQ